MLNAPAAAGHCGQRRVPRSDPQFLQFLRLRIAEVGTNQDNLTLYYREIRSGLQTIAREKP